MLENIFTFALFFLPGTFFCYILFPKTDLVKRVVFSMLLAVSLSGLLGIILYYFGQFSSINMVLGLLILSIIFALFLTCKKKEFQTYVNKDIGFITLLSLIGSLAKLYFFNSISNISDAYGYAFNFVGKKVPDLGFYTGMATDRASYIGLNVIKNIQDIFLTHNTFILYFLITFLFLGLIYIVFLEYRENRVLALAAVALMSFGPIELFHNLISPSGHSLSYISLLPFFLYFKSKDKNLFWVCLLIALTMMFTYYTTTIIMIIASCGFICAMGIKKIYHGKIEMRKLFGFLCIIVVLTGYVYIGTGLWNYSFGRLTDDSSFNTSLNLVSSSIGESVANNTHSNFYKNPSILGLSAIRWQALFFFVCGLTFVWYICKLLSQRKYEEFLTEYTIDLLLCLIPVVLVSLAFFFLYLPARIFDYFAFFGLLVLCIHKKYYRAFLIFSVSFILITSLFVARDTKVFFDLSPQESQGAMWVSKHLEGRIFTDMVFANQLIGQKYYNVTGTDDNNILVSSIFYQNNKDVFIQAIAQLKDNNISYIAITKRMKNNYVLMVNYPQRAIDTLTFFDYLPKVFDNGDVEIYSTAISL